MKKIILFVGVLVFGGAVYSQNSNGVYGTSRATNFNVSDWVDKQERNDFRRRDENRNRKSSTLSTGQDMYIFAGDENRTFLGCINCDKFSPYSIWNVNGKYGSKLESNSIWNAYGDFGGSQGKYSPFNKLDLLSGGGSSLYLNFLDPMPLKDLPFKYSS